MIEITNHRIALATPLTWTHVHTAFFDSFVVMDKPDCIYLRRGNGALADLRNELVKDAMNLGCSHIIMMDTDQTYPQDTIARLLAHDKPIVGALVHRRYPPFDPLLLTGDINNWSHIVDWEKNSLVKVDATGTGVLLFQTWVFNELPYPWFEFKKNPDEKLGGIIGEDIWFCHLVKEAGIPIFVDTSLKCGHLAYLEVTEKTHATYMKVSEDEL